MPSDGQPSPTAHRVAICYVADPGFYFPTILSIGSLRRFVSPEVADVYLFYIGGETADLDRLRACADRLSARLIPLDPERQVAFDATEWHRTHVPASSLGRFVFEPLLPTAVDKLLYVDGDTLFIGDPAPLLDYVLPPGTLAAAEDIAYFARRDWGGFGQRTREYLAGLGPAVRQGYFNAGVLLADRDAWRTIAGEALEFFTRNVRRCRYHDQSALNAVAGQRRLRLSPRWNFQTPFRFWDVEADVAPRILHFSQFPKPWMGSVEPWRDLHATLLALGRSLAAETLPVQALSPDEVEAFRRQSRRIDARLHGIMRARLLGRRRDIRRLVAASVL